MGEPLNNYEAVCTATALMIDPALFALRRSKVTISTVGIVPRILQVGSLLEHLSRCLLLNTVALSILGHDCFLHM